MESEISKKENFYSKVDSDTELLTSMELINKLKISDFSLRKMLKDPSFPRLKIGVDYRFIFSEVIDYIRYKAEPDSEFEDENE